MNILLTNDDGFDSKGITSLYKILSKNHNVVIVAPESNRSAVSHHLSMYSKNYLTKVDDNIYKHSGYPVDCVFTSLKSTFFNFKFDVVISGINHGYNLGTDIIYSGTCAAARESVLSGVPSIAVSLQKTEQSNFDLISEFINKNIFNLIKLSSTEYPRSFVNINAPAIENYKGVKFINKLCMRKFLDKIIVNKDFSLDFKPGKELSVKAADNDLGACEEGYVVITKILVEPFACELVDDMKISL